MPLKAEELPSPFQHEETERGVVQESSLTAVLWKVLVKRPEGLTLDDLVRQLDQPEVKKDSVIGSLKKSDVETVLENNDYFSQLECGNFVLSIYCSLKWGVAGVGKISDDFVAALSFLPGAEKTAAAGRDIDRAKQFAERHGFARLTIYMSSLQAYGSYEELAEDQEVQVVYVGNIHPQHKDTVLLMLNAGKHVLCEKPLSLNAAQAVEMVEAAQQRGLFLMEGHWDRFFPTMQAARSLVRRGAIGDVKHVESHFTMMAPESVERLYKRELGGGALLDIGAYPLSFINYIYEGEEPTEVHAVGDLQDGVDVHGTALMKYPNGKTATATFGFKSAAANGGLVLGTKGRIYLPDAHAPTELTVFKVEGSGPGAGEKAQTFKFDLPPVPEGAVTHGAEETNGFHFPTSEGFIFEAMATHSAIINGTHDMVGDHSMQQSVSLMQLMDFIRKILGVRYDVDRD